MDIFIGSIDAEPEAPVIWPADAKNQLIGKDPDAWKDWSQEQIGTTEDETVGWYQRFNEHEFEQTPENGEGPGKPGVLCSSLGLKESDTTEWLNNNTMGLCQ